MTYEFQNYYKLRSTLWPLTIIMWVVGVTKSQSKKYLYLNINTNTSTNTEHTF